MTIAPLVSNLTPSTQAMGTEAAVKVFAITDIPAAMDRLHWGQAARLMRKWFNNPPYEMPMDVKVGKVSATTLTPQ
uniref:DUF6402 family protein n=1 Tax=Staphylococcus borealis TaxID=2742203 RepID=UPI0039EA0F57